MHGRMLAHATILEIALFQSVQPPVLYHIEAQLRFLFAIQVDYIYQLKSRFSMKRVRVEKLSVWKIDDVTNDGGNKP